MHAHALVPADRHWYLPCWALDRDGWRTFRVDRLADVAQTRVLFTPRTLTPKPEAVIPADRAQRSARRGATRRHVYSQLRSRGSTSSPAAAADDAQP